MNLVVDMLMGMGLPRISLRGNAVWLLVAAPAMLLGAEVGGIRGVAVGVKNTHARVQLLLIASLYEKLAEHVGCESNALSEHPMQA